MKPYVLFAAAMLVAFPSNLRAANPHLTAKTRTVRVPAGTSLEAVSDNVATLKSKEGKYAFYDLDKQSFISGFKWNSNEGAYGKAPVFDGACSVTKVDGPNSWSATLTYFILHRDGTKVQLPAETQKLSPFVDGKCAIKYAAPEGRNTLTKVRYMDVDGNEVFADFTRLSNPKSSVKDARMSGLCDGMRAVMNVETGLWGYVDGNDKTIIGARFSEAGDFSEGLAFATTSSSYNKSYGILGKNGMFTVPEQLNFTPSGSLPVFSSGLAVLPGKNMYVDTKGKEVKPDMQLSAVSSFGPDERAFVNVEGDYNSSYILGKDMKVTKLDARYDLNALFGGNDSWDGHSHWLKSDGNIVLLDKDGSVVLSGSKFPGSYQWQSEIKAYSQGLALISYRKEADAQGDPGVCDPEGNIICLFSQAGESEEVKIEDKLPGAEITMISVTEYATIKVVSSPEGAGKCMGSGIFPKGAHRNLAAIPVSDEWCFVGWRCEDEQMQASLNKDDSFYAGPDQEVTAVFTKRPDNVPVKGAYAGDYNMDGAWMGPTCVNETIPVEVYLQLDPEGKIQMPYSGTYYGVLAISPKPGFRLSSTASNGSQKVTIKGMFEIMFAPYAITGTMEEQGRTYFTMIGGQRMAGDFRMDGRDKGEVEATRSFLKLASRGTKYHSVIFTNRVWDFRIEYTMRQDGTIALGKMQRYTSQYGWLDPDDNRLIKYRGYNTLLVRWTQRSESPVNGSLLEGASISPAHPHTVEYMPPEHWYADSKDPEGEKKEVLKATYEKTSAELFSAWTTREQAIKRMEGYSLSDWEDSTVKK